MAAKTVKMNNLFVWYSSSTKESGEALAAHLGCEHGTLPPKGYKGDVLCLGAAPAKGFKWEDRGFNRVINDPRKYRKFSGETGKAEVNKALAGNIGQLVRAFCVDGKVVQVVREGQEIPVPEAQRTTIEAFLCKKLDNPDFVAFDGVLSATSFNATAVVFGPALVGNTKVFDSIRDVYTPDRREELQTLIDAASPNERTALYNLLMKLNKKGEAKVKTA